MPLVVEVGLDCALCAHADVVDENVESPDATDDLFNGRLDGIVVSDVGADAQRSAGVLDGLTRRGGLQVEGSDGGAMGSEQADRRQAHSRLAAGDDGAESVSSACLPAQAACVTSAQGVPPALDGHLPWPWHTQIASATPA